MENEIDQHMDRWWVRLVGGGCHSVVLLLEDEAVENCRQKRNKKNIFEVVDQITLKHVAIGYLDANTCTGTLSKQVDG